MKHTILASIVCSGLLALPVSAFAQSESYDIKIEATDAVTALNVLGLQTEHPLLFNYNQVKDFRVNSLEGNYTLQQALNLILRDTGLSGSLSEREVISISLNTGSVTQPKEDPMTFKGKTKALVNTAASAALMTAMTATSVAAQDSTDNAYEDVVIATATTGSRIKRQENYSSPLARINADDISSTGAKDIRDIIGNLPINAGSENNADNLTQNFTVGTSNINLRGLGVASTLVLLNGKRQVLSSVATDDGSSFVDTAALVPTLAIERVEILKDGASAIYGSDAVAGVANFITRDSFNGAEIQAEYRTKTNTGSQTDFNIDGVLGGDFGDSGHFLLAASYLDRTSLTLLETDFDRPATSGFGNPATFIPVAGGAAMPDPECEADGGILVGTTCRFDFGPQVTVVPNEERIQTFARATWNWSDTTNLWGEIGYANNKISREVSPSFPVLNTPLVPEANPGNPFGEDVFFQGRPFGVGSPTEINLYEHSTYRVGLGADGEFNDNLYWDISYVTAANDAVLNPRDIIAENFQNALLGFGGNGCDTSPTAATVAVAGQGECSYFDPTDPTGNEGLRSFIVGDYIGNTESKLDVIEANITGSLFEMGGGDVGFAIGGQYREQSVDYAYDTITQQDGFGFLIGNPNFGGSTDVYALYGEVLLPINERLEVSGALRFEDYGSGIGDTLDPKVSALFRPTDELSLRASFSTSFRAPSVFQTAGVQTNFVNISDPLSGDSTFAGRRTVGDEALQPETSEAFNAGVTWTPGNDWNFNLDFWDFSFEDVLLKENAQAIVTANPNDTRIERTSAGTISIVNVAFINADAIETNGFDFSASKSFDFGGGTLTPSLNGTYVLTYDVTNNGVKIDGAGRLNRSNVGSPTPELRGNIGLNYDRGAFGANAYARYVDSYEDDGGVGIDSFTQFDVQASYNFGSLIRDDSETTLTVGLVNAFDEDPPFVAVSGSYDPRTGDPRGRRAYVKLGTKF